MIENFKIEKRKIPVIVSIKGNIGIVECTFIVDTGASHTIINEKVLKTIGYSKHDEQKRELLSGFGSHNIEVPFFNVKSLSCLGLIRRNFNLGFVEFRSTVFYDGILGIDFFLNHKLCVDFKKGLITLE